MILSLLLRSKRHMIMVKKIITLVLFTKGEVKCWFWFLHSLCRHLPDITPEPTLPPPRVYGITLGDMF